METGTKISSIAHGVAILFAAVGGPLFDSDPEESLRVSEVSLISGAELASLSPAAPQPDVQPTPIAPPEPAVTEPTPAPVAPPEPETAEPETPEPEQPETPVVEQQPDIEPEVAEPNEAQGTSDIEGVGQVAEEDAAGEITPDRMAILQPKPRPAERIADKVNEATEQPKPAEDAPNETPEPVEEPTPEETPEVAEPAQEESTTEIVTEADKQEETAAPVKSIRPKGRPLNVAQKIKDLVEQEKKIQEEIKAAEAQAVEDQVAQDIAAAIATAAAEQSNTTQSAGETASSGSSTSGSPLTQSEREGLIFKVQQCWNVPVAIQNASELKVTLRVSLDPDGHLKSSPELIDPVNSGLVGVQHAYEAGRRALIRCQPFKLPAEKYETWKEIEIVFNPQKMVLK